MKNHKYPLDAQEELDRIYSSVGATTPEQRFNLLELLIGASNWYPSDISIEFKLSVSEVEYLIRKGLIPFDYLIEL